LSMFWGGAATDHEDTADAPPRDLPRPFADRIGHALISFRDSAAVPINTSRKGHRAEEWHRAKDTFTLPAELYTERAATMPTPPKRGAHKKQVTKRPASALDGAIDRHRRSVNSGRMALTLGTSTTYFTGECSPALIIEVRESTKCLGDSHRRIGLALYDYAATHDTTKDELKQMRATFIAQLA